MSQEIYTKKLQAGEKTYFFDVKKASTGNKYLQISENRKDKKGQWKRNEITIFYDQLDKFIEALEESKKVL
ncbi:DUF3276 family protein [Patescibacteria group bacterium]|nr:DUF3276 family protein [Patescibacteria group bacterium]